MKVVGVTIIESVSIRTSYSFKCIQVYIVNGQVSGNLYQTISYQLLERHPFSGRCDSAGELLHTPYADSNFHGHRPAVCTTRNTLSRLSEGWSRYD